MNFLNEYQQVSILQENNDETSNSYKYIKNRKLHFHILFDVHVKCS